MTTETVLTDKEIIKTLVDAGILYAQDITAYDIANTRAIEQAVLQSEQVQAWKRDSERYRFIRDASCDGNEPLLNKARSEIRSRIPKDRIAPRYEDYDAGIDAAMEQRS